MKAKCPSKLITSIGETSGITRSRVKLVLNALQAEIVRELSPQGPGVFIMPGCFKVARKTVKARPERSGKNPFTGEMCTFKAKPTRNRYTIRALKSLRDINTK